MVRQSTRQLAVYRNPFSQATTDPKIPDGRVTQSMGMRMQVAGEVTQTNDGGTMEFLVYPGLNNGVSIVQRSSASLATDFVTPTFSDAPTMVAQSAGTPAVQSFQGDTANWPSRWRVVSQGLKLTLTNNAEQNDGWFEAIRFVPSKDEANYKSARPSEGATATGGPRFIVPVAHHFNTATNKSLVSHSSYMTGKVRDLHKYIFQLKCYDSSHDFRQPEDNYEVTAAVFTAAAETEIVNPSKLTGQDKELVEDLIDHSMDCILIRVHGQASTAIKTRLMYHLVANHELIYAPSKTLSRYMTETPPAVAQYERAHNALVSNTTPASIAAWMTPIRKRFVTPRKSTPRKRPTRAKK